MRYDPATGNKYCPKCKQTKHFTDFNKSKQNKDGFDGHCRECKQGRKQKQYPSPGSWKAWHEKNREMVNVKQRVRNAARRAKEAGVTGKFTAQEWLDLLAATGNKCLCCGATGDIQADHIVPISEGGDSFITNIQPLCKACNMAKGKKTTDYRP